MCVIEMCYTVTKNLSEILALPTSANKSYYEETFTSSQSLFERNNLESSIIYDDDILGSCIRDDHLDSLVASIAFG